MRPLVKVWVSNEARCARRRADDPVRTGARDRARAGFTEGRPGWHGHGVAEREFGEERWIRSGEVEDDCASGVVGDDPLREITSSCLPSAPSAADHPGVVAGAG